MSKLAIVTGASKGIGLALTRKLLAAHHQVIGTSRKGNIDAVSHPNFESFPLDLSNLDSITKFAEWFSTKELKIDLLLNNAGIGPDLETQYPEEKSYDQTFEVNVKGTVFLTELLIPSINPKGRILNVSSKMGSIEHCESSGSVAYRMSKSALNMYTKILANRLANTIDVVAIHPGWVRTSITPSSVNARLSPEESADKIMDYVNNRFTNGEFWDAESDMKLKW